MTSFVALAGSLHAALTSHVNMTSFVALAGSLHAALTTHVNMTSFVALAPSPPPHVRAMGPKLHIAEKALLMGLIPVTIVLSGIGLYCSVLTLIQDLKSCGGGGGGHIGAAGSDGVEAAYSAAEAAMAVAAAGALRLAPGLL